MRIAHHLSLFCIALTLFLTARMQVCSGAGAPLAAPPTLARAGQHRTLELIPPHLAYRLVRPQSYSRALQRSLEEECVELVQHIYANNNGRPQPRETLDVKKVKVAQLYARYTEQIAPRASNLLAGVASFLLYNFDRLLTQDTSQYRGLNTALFICQIDTKDDEEAGASCCLTRGDAWKKLVLCGHERDKHIGLIRMRLPLFTSVYSSTFDPAPSSDVVARVSFVTAHELAHFRNQYKHGTLRSFNTINRVPTRRMLLFFATMMGIGAGLGAQLGPALCLKLAALTKPHDVSAGWLTWSKYMIGLFGIEVGCWVGSKLYAPRWDGLNIPFEYAADAGALDLLPPALGHGGAILFTEWICEWSRITHSRGFLPRIRAYYTSSTHPLPQDRLAALLFCACTRVVPEERETLINQWHDSSRQAHVNYWQNARRRYKKGDLYTLRREATARTITTIFDRARRRWGPFPSPSDVAAWSA